MKFCDERIQKHLLNGGKIIYSGLTYPLFLRLGWIYFKNIDDEMLEYSISAHDLLAEDWEIVEPKYDWDKIIEDKVLCVFTDIENFENGVIISVLKRKDGDRYYNSRGVWYKYCKPFNPADFNIAKDLKEYEK
nr:MAG TPA: Protein of unknown function (DUF2829) [Siphoviridae sp. ctD5s5]